MGLRNLDTNRYECKFYIVVLKIIKTFFHEIQFLQSSITIPRSIFGK